MLDPTRYAEAQGVGLLGVDQECLQVMLKHIASTIPPDNRWQPIFHRYLANVAGRVDAYGNDPDLVHGNPDGTGVVWIRTRTRTARRDPTLKVMAVPVRTLVQPRATDAH